MDSYGGAASDRPASTMSGNSIRGVAADNPLGRTYHDAATRTFGEAHPYTGNQEEHRWRNDGEPVL